MLIVGGLAQGAVVDNPHAIYVQKRIWSHTVDNGQAAVSALNQQRVEEDNVLQLHLIARDQLADDRRVFGDVEVNWETVNLKIEYAIVFFKRKFSDGHRDKLIEVGTPWVANVYFAFKPQAIWMSFENISAVDVGRVLGLNEIFDRAPVLRSPGKLFDNAKETWLGTNCVEERSVNGQVNQIEGNAHIRKSSSAHIATIAVRTRKPFTLYIDHGATPGVVAQGITDIDLTYVHTEVVGVIEHKQNGFPWGQPGTTRVVKIGHDVNPFDKKIDGREARLLWR